MKLTNIFFIIVMLGVFLAALKGKHLIAGTCTYYSNYYAAQCESFLDSSTVSNSAQCDAICAGSTWDSYCGNVSPAEGCTFS